MNLIRADVRGEVGEVLTRDLRDNGLGLSVEADAEVIYSGERIS
jgi:hypothetical protein